MNIWPKAIIGTFVLFAAGLAAFIVVATREPVELVARDYYDQEIKHEQQMRRAARAGALATPLIVVHNEARREITITFPEIPSGGTVHLYRPSNVKLDRTFPVDSGTSRVQNISTRDLAPGLWKLRVRWTMHGEEHFQEETTVL